MSSVSVKYAVLPIDELIEELGRLRPSIHIRVTNLLKGTRYWNSVEDVVQDVFVWA